MRALARIRTAEVLVYDRLVDPALVAEAPPTAERVFAGKARGFAALEQREIEALLIARASPASTSSASRAATPTSSVAAARSRGAGRRRNSGRGGAGRLLGAGGAGQRGHPGDPSRALLVADDRHRARGSDESRRRRSIGTGWRPSKGTLVILMGLSQLPGIRDRLIAGGRSPETPAAAIASGTRPDQRVVTAPLADLPEVVAAAQLVAPALVVVGDVVRCRELLAPSGAAGDGHPGEFTREPDRFARVEPGSQPARVGRDVSGASLTLGTGPPGALSGLVIPSGRRQWLTPLSSSAPLARGTAPRASRRLLRGSLAAGPPALGDRVLSAGGSPSPPASRPRGWCCSTWPGASIPGSA